LRQGRLGAADGGAAAGRRGVHGDCTGSRGRWFQVPARGQIAGAAAAAAKGRRGSGVQGRVWHGGRLRARTGRVSGGNGGQGRDGQGQTTAAGAYKEGERRANCWMCSRPRSRQISKHSTALHTRFHLLYLPIYAVIAALAILHQPSCYDRISAPTLVIVASTPLSCPCIYPVAVIIYLPRCRARASAPKSSSTPLPCPCTHTAALSGIVGVHAVG
jgi:hypothetical protein